MLLHALPVAVVVAVAPVKCQSERSKQLKTMKCLVGSCEARGFLQQYIGPAEPKDHDSTFQSGAGYLL